MFVVYSYCYILSFFMFLHFSSSSLLLFYFMIYNLLLNNANPPSVTNKGLSYCFCNGYCFWKFQINIDFITTADIICYLAVTKRWRDDADVLSLPPLYISHCFVWVCERGERATYLYLLCSCGFLVHLVTMKSSNCSTMQYNMARL